jgi:hypothetical protein
VALRSVAGPETTAAARGEWEAIDEPGSAESASNVPQYPV